MNGEDRRLVRQLAGALSGRTNGRSWGEDFRYLVPELLPSLKDALTHFGQRTPRGSYSPADQAARQSDVAEAIGRSAFRLVRLISKHRPAILEAVRMGYLRWRPGQSGGPQPLADVAIIDWTTGREATAVLRRMVDEVAFWQIAARSQARRPPGPKVGERPILTEYIGLLLKARDIPLTTGRRGYYARVLGVMYSAAGITSTDFERDIRAAFKAQPQLSRSARTHRKI